MIILAERLRMEDKEIIRQLQKDLQQLQQQIDVQQAKIDELQQRLNQISSEPYIQPVVKPTPSSQTPHGALENFIGLRLIHLVGIVVLVIGLSIGVKYAFDKQLISETTRIILAYAAGAVLYLLSLRLRKNYILFSGILFSGAMASLYFTTYGAYVYYNMFSATVAFAVMMLLTIFTAVQALEYDRKEIAILSLVGAYGIPFLISKNADKADLFFLYMLIINAAVAYLCIKKDWKIVGRIAQLLTTLIFLGWAAMRYKPADRGIAVIYMLLFFLLFSVIVLAPKWLKKESFSRQDSHQQGLNNIFLYLSSILILAPHMGVHSLAAVTGFFALFAALQTGVYYAFLRGEVYIRKLHFILAFALLILFIALEWDGLKVTLLWLLLALLTFAWGIAIKSVSLRMAGISLMGLTLLKLLVLDSMRFTTVQKLISYLVLGILLLLVSFFYQKFKQKLFDDEG